MHFAPGSHGELSGGLYVDKTMINKPINTDYSIPFGYFEGFRTVLMRKTGHFQHIAYLL